MTNQPSIEQERIFAQVLGYRIRVNTNKRAVPYDFSFFAEIADCRAIPLDRAKENLVLPPIVFSCPQHAMPLGAKLPLIQNVQVKASSEQPTLPQPKKAKGSEHDPHRARSLSYAFSWLRIAKIQSVLTGREITAKRLEDLSILFGCKPLVIGEARRVADWSRGDWDFEEPWKFTSRPFRHNASESPAWLKTLRSFASSRVDSTSEGN